MGNFKQLNVWIRAKDLSVYLYKLTTNPKRKIYKDFGMKDQMQRSVVSISSNIAEGEQLDTNKQSTKHLYISRGSAAELWSQCIISYEIGYLDKEELDYFEEEIDAISGMLTRLIKSRSN